MPCIGFWFDVDNAQSILASWGDRILQLTGILKISRKTADGDPFLHQTYPRE